ncbi:TA system antitoxin ParD family protein [Gordonia insulae]|uniref:ParD-like antitoxin of type II toxin-antitoxin system n=1 Tax=Gordonia insulae TaxID=2420509 RepID=A0A3G8JRB0_9ACTN|nr:hypothetical protein [Gordonia insulae]AZG47637.1 hypothetical protein D7316_04249 [Gordonia insulae]
MTRAADKVTRVDADLVDSAIAEGRRQQRTGRQQLEYWARVGRALTTHESASLRRVQAALSGAIPTTDLGGDEGRAFNAQIRARVSEDLATADYRRELSASGVTTVSLDEAGRIVEHLPDGTTRVLDDE